MRVYFKSVVLLSNKQGAPSQTDKCKRRLKCPDRPDQERRRPFIISPHHFQSYHCQQHSEALKTLHRMVSCELFEVGKEFMWETAAALTKRLITLTAAC